MKRLFGLLVTAFLFGLGAGSWAGSLNSLTGSNSNTGVLSSYTFNFTSATGTNTDEALIAIIFPVGFDTTAVNSGHITATIDNTPVAILEGTYFISPENILIVLTGGYDIFSGSIIQVTVDNVSNPNTSGTYILDGLGLFDIPTFPGDPIDVVDNVASFPIIIEYTSATFSGGDGTPGNPYQISTCEQLQLMESELGASYVLINDIDCSATTGWNGGLGFDPVGTQATPFTGSFDGSGFTISDLFIEVYTGGSCDETTDYVGLFGYAENADMSNVALMNSYTQGCAYVGGLVGGMLGGSISHVHVSGYNRPFQGFYGGLLAGSAQNVTITQSSSEGESRGSGIRIGGLVGYANNTTISHSHSTATVDGGNSVGGLVGWFVSGSILHSYATGDVFVDLLVDSGYFNNPSKNGNNGGGLVGEASNLTVAYSYALGDVRGDGDNVGGLVGSAADSTFENISMSGYTVEGLGELVGGLVGRAVGSTFSGITLQNISVSGDAAGGGLIGGIPDSANPLSISNITIENPSIYASDRWPAAGAGGLVGYISYSDVTIENIAVLGGSVTNPDIGECNCSAGGLIGEIRSSEGLITTITDSYATIDVISASVAGGLVGSMAPGSISTSYFSGDVIGGFIAGGIAGLAEYSTVENVYVLGSVSTTIDDFFALGAGGIVGYFYEANNVINSYAAVELSGTVVGGIFGTVLVQEGIVANVVFDEDLADTDVAFWIDDEGLIPTTGGTYTTVEMKMIASYQSGGQWIQTDTGFDITYNATPMNNGYPFLGRQIGEDSNVWYINSSIVCSPGTYEDEGSCQVCPVGTFQDSFGATSCQVCPEGTYQDNVGATSCIEIDTTTPQIGSGGPIQDYCPNGDFSGSYYDGDCGDKTVEVESNTTNDNTTSGSNSTNKECANSEYQAAYEFAYGYSITTMPSCSEANMDGILIRAHAAKMMSNYAINVLGKAPDTSVVCAFDDMDDQTVEMQGYAIIACQLGLMGLDADGVTPAQSFNPDDVLDKAQFATVLSRLLYGEEHNGNTACRYCDHVAALQDAEIIKITTDLFDPLRRAFAMIMLMRTQQ